MKFHLPALFLLLVLLTSYVVGQQKPAAFPPLEQWKTTVLAGNPAGLKALYSSNPAPQIGTPGGQTSADSDVSFWTGFKARSIKLNILQSTSPQPGLQQVVFEAEIQAVPHTVYVTEGQLWQQQSGQWKLVASKRSDPTRLQQPTSTDKMIYAPDLDAHAEIKQALALAAKEHKRVILVFGANWCYDCHVLDLAFHRPDLASVLQHSYEVVHIDVGQGDKNQDIMQQYQVPMKKGIPALAVLDSNGKLLYSQQGGEFEKTRSLAPEDLLAFLNKWKPAAQ
ncbi:MAG: thioredoxin family protein [Candidatus Korobacteraceae bacterium]